MKVKFVSIENSIIAVGLRRMVSFARSLYSDVEACFITPGNMYSTYSFLVKSGDLEYDLSREDLESIAEYLSSADMICFSCMTMLAGLTKKIIKLIKSIRPQTYIIWGGIHSIVYPEDAIQYADAVCVGEGETAFRDFFFSYKNGEDYTKTKNFWFNVNGRIIKNDFLPLHTSEELTKFPLTLYAENELIYKNSRGFIPMTVSDYLSFNGLSYNTVWAIGCPYRCSYCSNSKFIENDKNYAKLRYPSVDYLIAEVKQAVKKHPHISTVSFADDSFMAIPIDTLKAFAEKWRKEVKIPFCVQGIIPVYVQREKMKVLIWAGMNRLRMGIQSGSDRILKFYRRPNRPGLIANATSIIAEFSDYIIHPAYDIILDNPIENRQDVIDTLELLYNMPRPFTLNIFSLRVIPNTVLARDLEERGIAHPDINSSYFVVKPTLANVMVHALVVFKPPRKIFSYLLKYVKAYGEEQPLYPIALHFFRVIYLFKRGFSHLRFMDFSILPGRAGWVLWKLGVTRLWRDRFLKRPDEVISEVY